jgi:cysteine-rich repeat protein
MFTLNHNAERGGRRVLRSAIRTACGVGIGIIALSATARAQCVGDCDGGNTVTINELIIGVNIALESAQVSACPVFDANDSGAVEINELIAAVRSALEGCPPPGDTPTATVTSSTPIGATPTATSDVTAPPTPTATPDGPACESPTPVSAEDCGDGTIDLEGGETCDDGNTDEGDDCPANCRIATCEPSGTTLTLRFDFDTIPDELFIQGLQLFVRYPDGILSIPGSVSEPPVLENVTSELFSVTPFDRDYGVTVTLTDSSFLGYESGEAATVVFDVCAGAPVAPTACDVSCTVTSAVDALFNDVPVEQVPCTIVAE